MKADTRVLVIGIGNGYRGDDAVGLVVARKVKPLLPPSVKVLEMSGDPAVLMESWKGADAVIVIDAVVSGNMPGTLYEINARKDALPNDLFLCSTHAFGIGEAIELARSVGELPPNLIVLGIEGKNFEISINDDFPMLSPEVRDVVSIATEEVKTLCMNFRSLAT